MTVKVDKEMRRRIEILKSYEKGARMNFTKKERVAKLDINDTGWIYTSPDHGKTLYREAVSQPYDDVSGVKLDKNPTDLKRTKKIESIFDQLNDLEAQVREIRKSLVELG